MVGKYRESKEEIKDRMIKTALDFWNIKNVENLDPFIRLLIEALAMQLHLITDDIADIELRTMRRVSEVLLPQSYSVAKPAHALAHITPLVDGVKVGNFSGFSLSDPFFARNDNLRFTFYPVAQTPLRMASVKMLVIEESVYEVMPDLSKKLLSRSSETLPENVGKVLIGVDFEGDTFDLEQLSFYVDFPNVDRRREYLYQLSHCQWQWKGEVLRQRQGLISGVEGEREPLDEPFFDASVSKRIDSQVMALYAPNFITLLDEIQIDKNEKVDAVSYIKNNDLKGGIATKPLLWLAVSFPSNFSYSILEDMQILLNVVPLVNKELHEVTTSVKKSFGVMPLPLAERESFLDVISVEDEMGTSYTQSGVMKGGGVSGFYSLRQGGCETFDMRDAKDYLMRLQQLLEDEMALFSASGVGRNTENRYLIENLVSKISMVSKNIETTTEALHYLFVTPPQETTLYYLKYWTTYGSWANGIRVGVKLNPKEEMYGEIGQAQLVTSSIGGVGVPSERERIAQFKYLLGSRDRIVTNADIENFCYASLAELLKEVYVCKGVQVSRSPNEGLVRTIDVHLVMKDEVDDKQRNSLIDKLYDDLVSRSPMTFNYRIILD